MAPLSRGLELLESAVRYALAGAALGAPQLLPRPTPCPGWDLEALLDHLSDSIGVLTGAITGDGARAASPGYPGPGPDPVARLRGQAAGLLGAFSAAGPAGRRVAIWDRELTVSMVAVTGALEITVHGWDIFVACGARRSVPPGLAAVLLPIAPLLISPGTRPGLFADPVRLPGPACPGDQLVAFLGRQPRPKPRPVLAAPKTTHPAQAGQKALKVTSRPAAIPRSPAGLYKWAAEQAARKPQEHPRAGGTDMTIYGKTVLVTGANRGIGQALVAEALSRGAERVYAGTRQPLAHPDGRVTAVRLDVTDAAQIQAAAEKVGSLDILINNAGIALYDDLSDRAALEQHLAVNLFGTYGVTQAFLPLLTPSRGAIVNNVSTMALAPFPFTPAYAISKAAAFNLTQSLRALLAGRGVRVHAVLTGPTDTDMTRGSDIPKASPESVARAIFDGVENEEEDIFPDPASQSIADSWRSGAVKALERENAAFVPAASAAA